MEKIETKDVTELFEGIAPKLQRKQKRATINNFKGPF